MSEPSDGGQADERSATALLFLHALTPLHPGTGAGLGTVDLPVQRERMTGWPLIQASSVKGVLRAACRPEGNGDDRQRWLAAFGPETGEAAEHAGAVRLTDARLLAFPVRSLKGVFAWITCPAVLHRFSRDRQLAGLAALPEVKADPQHARTARSSPLLLNEGHSSKLVLEEFDFTQADEIGGGILDALAEAVAETDAPVSFRDHLVVLHDDDFGYFVRHATEIAARIALDYDTKTVKGTALFYQEFLPAETLFYCAVLTDGSRKREVPMTGRDVLAYLRGQLTGDDGRAVLQIGGDETIGKGLCRARLTLQETDAP